MMMKKKDKPLTKTQRFFMRLPHTTFFNPDFVGNMLDKKLIEYVKKDNIEDVRNIIRKGANINTKDGYGKTALILAVENGNLNMVEFLLENNIRTNLKDSLNRTAIHYASSQRNLKILSALLTKYSSNKDKLKKKVNAKDANGNTPLHIAAMSDNYGVAAFLINKGASRNSLNNDNETPFTLAKKTNNQILLKLLF